MAAPPLHQRLRFDTEHGQVLDDDRRYVLLRADVLMGMFELLPAEARNTALSAFARSVFTYGSNSVRAYDAAAEPRAPQLFHAVAQGALSLGWGVWHFDVGATCCRLRVENSPFAAPFRSLHTPACAAIAGMLQAVCSHAWQRDCVAVEVQCSACTSDVPAPLPSLCVFEATTTDLASE